MAAKPSSTPRWATNTGSVEPPERIVPPNEAKKDAGFGHGERPPPQFVNWQWNLVYQWIEWFASADVVVVQVDSTKFVNIEGFGPGSDLNPTTDAASNAAWIPLDLPRGWHVTKIEAEAIDSGDGSATVSFAKQEGIGSGAPVAIATITGWGATESVRDADEIDEEIVANTKYGLWLVTPGGWDPGAEGEFTVGACAVYLARVGES